MHNEARPILTVGKAPEKENQTISKLSSKISKVPVCYLCGQEGHIKSRCPQYTVKLIQMCCVPRLKMERELKPQHSLKTTTVRINGQDLKALIETGSTQTLVHQQYVPRQPIRTTDIVPICCVHGNERPYPTTDVYIKVEGQCTCCMLVL